MRVEVDSLRLHVPRGVERLGGERDVDLFPGLELLAEFLGERDLLLEEHPAPLRAALLLDGLLEEVRLGEVFAVVQGHVDPVAKSSEVIGVSSSHRESSKRAMALMTWHM